MDDDLCTSCLCNGRKLFAITETGFETLYTGILNEISIYDFSRVHIRVCWECKAWLRRFNSFKKQVKVSYTQLLRALHGNNLRNLHVSPQLNTYQVHSDSIHPQIKTENDIHIKHEYEDMHCEPASFVNNLEFKTLGEEKQVDYKQNDGLSDDFCNDDVVELSAVQKEVKKTTKEKVKKNVKSKKQKPKTEKKFGVKKKSTKSNLKEKDSDMVIELEDVKDEINKTEKDKNEDVESVSNEEVPLAKLPRAPPNREVLPERPQCAECGKQFSSRKTYRYHIEVLHKGKNQHPCPRCGKVYQWKSNLGRHMRTHTARDTGELYCEKCDKRFASVATYRQHLRVSRRHVSESDFSFMCNDCGKKFVSKTRLRDHIDWDHLNTVKFRCQLCHKPFKTYTSLYVHLQNVHRNKEKKDNLCHVCGKSYQNPAKLRYHIVAMHTSETPYQCAQCDASFGWYSSLYRHVKEVHYKIKLQPNRSKKLKKDANLPPIEGGPAWSTVRAELLSNKKNDSLPELLAQPFVVPVESHIGT